MFGPFLYCLDGFNDTKFSLEKKQVRYNVCIAWLLVVVCLTLYEAVDRVRCGGERSKSHFRFLIVKMILTNGLCISII